MARAPLPENNTARLWVQYQSEAGTHELMFRFLAGVTSSQAAAEAARIIGSLKAFATTATSFNAARFSNVGTLLSFPVTWTPIAGTSAEAMTGDEYPNFISFVGRSIGGRRTRVTLNGIPANADTDYRLLSADNASVAAVLTALRLEPVLIHGIDGEPIIWNSYANLGRNAYFQRKRRQAA